MNRNIYVKNTPLTEAQDKWQAKLAEHGCLAPPPAEEVLVDDSLGRTTGEAVFAPRSSPFYNASAMDGIAVRFRETSGASEAAPVHLAENKQFAYVNTGNVLPRDFDETTPQYRHPSPRPQSHADALFRWNRLYCGLISNLPAGKIRVPGYERFRW